MKTHLCGVLVHEIGLYADVWIDAHHKHNSNQVITLVMNAICDVKQRKDFLPLTLKIQVDNTIRKNKNIYMFAMCATLVGVGFFQEVHLCFLIVGHIHEDIDQRFSVISNILKRKVIDMLKEMLELVEKGTSYTEAFVTARKVEHIHDWKTFITPHLLQGGDQLTSITFPHHMRFYIQNRIVYVQYKHFYIDEWGPKEGHLCLNSIPSGSTKPNLVEAFAADQRELKALDDFIAYKDTLVIRGGVNLYKNMKVADDLRKFKKYLEEFPESNKNALYKLPFWLGEVQNDSGDGDVIQDAEDAPSNSNTTLDRNANVEDTTTVDLIMATMPNVERRGYFGPCKDKPPPEPSQRLTGRKKRIKTNTTITEVVRNEDGDFFPPYSSKADNMVGQFVALIVELSEIQGGVPFYIGKVIEFGQRRWSANMKVLWYWPTRGRRAKEERGSNRERGMQTAWKLHGNHLEKGLVGLTKRQLYIHGWMFLEEDKVGRREV